MLVVRPPNPIIVPKVARSLAGSQNTPERRNEDNGAGGGNGNHLYVNSLNYHANDLTELRKLSAENPALADKIVDNQERREVRKERSYRLGLVVAGFLAVTLVGAGAYVLTSLGWLQTLGFVTILLGVSHVLRVVLTGEFSDTSWFGHLISGKKNQEDKPSAPEGD